MVWCTPVVRRTVLQCRHVPDGLSSIWATEPAPPGATTTTESLLSSPPPRWRDISVGSPREARLVAVVIGEQELAADRTIDMVEEGAGDGEVQAAAGEQLTLPMYVCEVRLRLPCEVSLWQHLVR